MSQESIIREEPVRAPFAALPPIRSRLVDGATAALLLLLPALLYRGVTSLWWMSDDLAVVGFAARHRPWDYFFSPAVWQELPWRFMVQLQILTFDLDLALFGPDPALFYVHHLVAFGLCAAVLFLVLLRWLALSSALCAVLLFLLAPPLCTVAQQLMVRHYVEGLTIAALAVACYLTAVRRDSPLWAGLAGVLALAASLAKEVYVPLPFLLPALPTLPTSTLRTRLRHAAPAFAALLVHLAWRRWMLGEWTGGYGYSLGPAGWTGILASLPGQLGAGLFALPAPAGWMLLAAFLTAAIAVAADGWASAVRLAWVAGLVLAPILPVAEKVAPRFLFVPSLFVALVVVLGARSLGRRFRSRTAGATGTAGIALLLVALPAAAVLYAATWRATSTLFHRYSEEGRFVFRRGPGDLLRRPAAESHFLHGVVLLKQQLGRGAGAGWFQDDYFLCIHELGDRRVWAFLEGPSGAGRFRDITGRLPGVRRRVCDGAQQAPLAVELTWQAGRLSWRLGPYERGSYAVLLAGGLELFEVERFGGMRFDRRPGLALRVRYQAPEGWVAYSPELSLDFARQPVLRWQRGAAPPEDATESPPGIR